MKQKNTKQAEWPNKWRCGTSPKCNLLQKLSGKNERSRLPPTRAVALGHTDHTEGPLAIEGVESTPTRDQSRVTSTRTAVTQLGTHIPGVAGGAYLLAGAEIACREPGGLYQLLSAIQVATQTTPSISPLGYAKGLARIVRFEYFIVDTVSARIEWKAWRKNVKKAIIIMRPRNCEENNIWNLYSTALIKPVKLNL